MVHFPFFLPILPFHVSTAQLMFLWHSPECFNKFPICDQTLGRAELHLAGCTNHPPCSLSFGCFSSDSLECFRQPTFNSIVPSYFALLSVRKCVIWSFCRLLFFVHVSNVVVCIPSLLTTIIKEPSGSFCSPCSFLFQLLEPLSCITRFKFALCLSLQAKFLPATHFQLKTLTFVMVSGGRFLQYK